MTGRLIAVVGPSGVGKDTVMVALSGAEPGWALVRRTITRDPPLGGEDFAHLSEEAFGEHEARGAFCLSWRAHGLCYGIPADLPVRVAVGETLLVNLSRGVLEQASTLVARFVVLNVTAAPETLMRRLAGRGRESRDEIAQRLARPAPPWPPSVPVFDLPNDGALEATVAVARALLQPVRG